MTKKFLTIAVAAALAAPMAAMADATIYGKGRLAVESFEVDTGTAATSTDNMRIQNYSSRVGIKGSEDLGNGLKGIYAMEFGVNIANNNYSAMDDGGARDEFAGGNSLGNRNAFVGLAGDWGTFLVGRHDTPLKISTGSLDYFADQAGDNNASYAEAFADRRANGTLAYVSPSMGGLTLAAAIVPGENAEADGLTDAYSVALMYSNGGIYGSLAYEAGDGSIDALGGAGEPGDLAQMRVGLGYDAGAWKVGAAWENVQVDTQAGGDLIDQDKWAINGAYNFGNNTVKAKYFDVSESADNADDGHDGFAIGLDHNFSKRTQVYAVYTDSSADNDVDTTVWGVGLNHNF